MDQSSQTNMPIAKIAAISIIGILNIILPSPKIAEPTIKPTMDYTEGE